MCPHHKGAGLFIYVFNTGYTDITEGVGACEAHLGTHTHTHARARTHTHTRTSPRAWEPARQAAMTRVGPAVLSIPTASPAITVYYIYIFIIYDIYNI